MELGRLRGTRSCRPIWCWARCAERLRDARAPRVPTLRRLVAAALVPFLTDREHEPAAARPHRARGDHAVVARPRARSPAAGSRRSTTRLAALYAAATPARPPISRARRRPPPPGWTKALVAELAKPKGDAALRQLFPRPGLIADVGAIARALALAEPLGTALAASNGCLPPRHGSMGGASSISCPTP